MKIEDKYSLTDDKKIVISNDAYAVIDLIQQLIDKLEKVRVSFGN